MEVPGKSGLPRSISARMHPRLHMSTPIVQRFDASRISGALVIIMMVMILMDDHDGDDHADHDGDDNDDHDHDDHDGDDDDVN